MTSRRWRAAATLATAAIATASLAMPAGASMAAASQLAAHRSVHQPSSCFTTGGGSEYLELNLNGTWSTPLTFGVSGLSAGGSSRQSPTR